MTNKTYTSEELKKIFKEQIEECIESINATYSISKVKMHRNTAFLLIDEALYLELIDNDEEYELTSKVCEEAQKRIDILS